ncbi:MAG TPA: hypothetical protein VMF62_19365 [Acetobacteraceae bacterium]|nr:hypothetical protein [Acetobacteraceae bacterium]
MRAWPLLAAALALAGCGDFPRPFQGNPGATALRLAVPPPPLLAVPAPPAALLADAASRKFAADVATALADRTVPAVAAPTRPGDWQLAITASLEKSEVIPRYTVIDPIKRKQGSIAGTPVPAEEWANADPAALEKTANADAPAIANLLTEIDARLKRSNPESLMNRPAKVFFAGVRNAPYDGNIVLARALRTDLPALGVPLQASQTGADFSVIGEVQVTPTKQPEQVRVELQWVVSDARGRERGRVIQLNDVPLATIDPTWGEVAPTIGEQAASGLRQLIEKARQAP